jgi:hypothetical protein
MELRGLVESKSTMNEWQAGTEENAVMNGIWEPEI